MPRPNVLTIAVLVALLVGIDIGLRLAPPSSLPAAAAQAGPSGVEIAAAATQNDAFCFLYNPATKQLLTYRQTLKATGAELQGIRTCASDFNPAIIEYPSSQSPTAVRKMNALAEKLKKQSQAGGAAPPR